jgi:chorismate synthase
MDKRSPRLNKNTTQRQEADAVEILSGVFEGQTTGTPDPTDPQHRSARSKDYGDIAGPPRPGHADITYHIRNTAAGLSADVRSFAKPHHANAAGGVARESLTKAMAPP